MGLLPNLRAWHLINTDTAEVIDGDFEAEEVSRNITTTYGESTSLNRQQPITQFLHGNAEVVSFQARFFADSAFSSVTGKFEKLVSWAKRDEELGRPPVVGFWIGDGDTAYGNFFSVIESISDIKYDSPTATGAVRGVTCTITLRQFEEFDIAGVTARSPPETRFHAVRDGEYMELIAEREYGRPLLGDVVRKRHPRLQQPNVGDIIKLPSLEAIRRVSVQPTSIALRGLTVRKDSPQRRLLEFHTARLNRSMVSTSVPEGL